MQKTKNMHITLEGKNLSDTKLLWFKKYEGRLVGLVS